VESRNAKFLENDFMSGSNQSEGLAPKNDNLDTQPSASSIRLVVIHNDHSVQLAIE